MTIGDLFDPVYVIYAPKTFILKLCIGLITGFVAHRLGHIDESSDQGHVLRFAAAGAICGLVFNMIFDPLFGYYYKLLILGKAGGRARPCMERGLHLHQCSSFHHCFPCDLHALRRALIRSGLVDKLK